MTTISVTTLKLAMAIGAYLAAVGLGALLNGGRWKAAIACFDDAPALDLLAGAVAFAIGAAIILVHNQWRDPLAIIVSLIGWAALAKGMALMIFDRGLLRLSRPIALRPAIWGVALLIGGMLLFLAGLTGRADPTQFRL